jgi:transposase
VVLATGHTDMRKGFDGLALLVQKTLRRNPHSGHLFVFPTSPRRRATATTALSPIAFEAVRKMDAVFELERSINGLSSEARVAARRQDIAPPVNELIEWMKQERAKLSRHTKWPMP